MDDVMYYRIGDYIRDDLQYIEYINAVLDLSEDEPEVIYDDIDILYNEYAIEW